MPCIRGGFSNDKVDAVNEIIASGNRDACDAPLIIPGEPVSPRAAIDHPRSALIGAYNSDIDTWYDLHDVAIAGIVTVV